MAHTIPRKLLTGSTMNHGDGVVSIFIIQRESYHRLERSMVHGAVQKEQD